ncbi:MAG: S8 family serine peptidase [Cyanobacteria bacterium P01_A01_bin.84]
MYSSDLDYALTTDLSQNINSATQVLTDNNDNYGLALENQSSSYISLQDISESTDILWRNYATGENAVWYMDNSVLTNGAYLTPEENINWSIEATGDFNNDGEADILWRNYATGDNYLEYMNDGILNGGVYLTSVTDTSWSIEETGDFNSDGETDILWRNYTTGDNAVWYMNDSTLTNGAYITPVTDINWNIEGTGDFNSDGETDILWRNYTTGENALWYMNDSTLTNGAYITPVTDTRWNIEGTGDFNSDGETDILWRNYTTGENALWYMNDSTLTNGAYITPVTDTNWTIAGVLENFVEPGESLNTAYDIGVLDGNITITDYIGGIDTNDYFSFTLNDVSHFQLTLSDLTADAIILQLLDSNGNIIASSTNSNDDETINLQLAADNYYVRVYPYSGSTNYNLNLSTPDFDSTYGYGLVNAAEAVARAIGQSTFSDVPNLEDINWGNDMINAPEVWTRGYTGEGITVAVIDSGVDIYHDDLDSNIWRNSGEIEGNGIDDDGNGYVDDVYGWNFIDGDNDVLDGNGHGTHVGGTIAAENNNFGVTGVAYNAEIMAVRVFDDSGKTEDNSIVNGIYYAVDNGADVINLSLGGGEDPNEELAIEYATSQGVIVVMAAGNDNDPVPTYPANYATEYGISVGAVDRYGDIYDFSNLAGDDSNMHHVMAPGVDVYSTIPDYPYYLEYSGTSMATPHVAGVVALMLSANPNLTPAQVREILTDTATRLA